MAVTTHRFHSQKESKSSPLCQRYERKNKGLHYIRHSSCPNAFTNTKMDLMLKFLVQMSGLETHLSWLEQNGDEDAQKLASEMRKAVESAYETMQGWERE